MNTLPHPSVPSLPGQLAVSGNQISTIVGSTVTPLVAGNTLTVAESDAGYFESANIPITRIGSNSYLPIDIKADFRGAIQPWSQLPYILVEADGSAAGLRPGYNGEYIRIFYAYSATGAINATDFQLTDSEYRPLWLAADEYVTAIVDSSTNGFLINIKSTTNLGLNRYYWVDHNSTLDSRFHTFLDVTANMTTAVSGYTAPGPIQLGVPYNGGGGGTYIRETNMWVQVQSDNYSKAAYSWFSVNRAFQSVRSSALAAALPAVSVDWTDISQTLSGTNNVSVLIDATGTNASKYITPLNPPSTPITTYMIYPNGGRIGITYAYSNGIVRMLTNGITYIPYSNGGIQFAWSITMDYNVAANTLRYNPVTTDPVNFQTLPWVVNFNDSVTINNGTAPNPITPAYKANKLPIATPGQVGTGLSVGNQMTKFLFSGTKMIALTVSTTSPTGFFMGTTEVSEYNQGSTELNRFNALARPYYNRTFPGYQEYVPYDASILSKVLTFVSFMGPTNLAGYSLSRLYGQATSNKCFNATLPNVTTTSTVYSVDSNTQQPCLATPTSVALAGSRHSRAGFGTVIRTGGAMQVNQATMGDLDAYAATWLAVNLDPITGVPASTYAADPATFKSKLAQIATAMQTASAYKPTGAVTSAYEIMPFFVDQANSFAYFVFSMVWGNPPEGFQHEHSIIRLSLSGGNVVWPATASSAMLSQVSGYRFNQASQAANAAQAFPAYGSCGAYQSAAGNWYLLIVPATYIGIQGGNYGDIRFMTLNSSFAITQSSQQGTQQTWLSYRAGIHPTFGLYLTDTWQDSNAKARMQYKDHRSTTDQATRIQACCDDWTNNAATSTLFVLSSKSASGFILYASEVSVFMNGHVGTIPTQTIALNTITASPANKKFLFYVQWDGSKFVLTGSLTPIAESATTAYFGSVTTNATGITLSDLQKVTRIDTYRIETDAPIVGSAIRGPQSS